MKYANFKDTGRTSVNIGDYLQFMAAERLLRLMNVPESDIIRLGFRDIAEYDGEPVVFPFCYSIIDFVSHGKIAISPKIKPVFFAVTLSTVDRFMEIDQFLADAYNHSYLAEHGPVGCRDEVTYTMLTAHHIPAYINGCMTAILPKRGDRLGDKTLFVDAPYALLPYIPATLLENCQFSTQQYYFEPSAVEDYRGMFAFVSERYRYYQENARIAVTSRLHVALPLTALGIPVVLAKDNIDGRFSFIERYLPIYGKDRYHEINWFPDVPDIEPAKRLLVEHALGRLQGSVSEPALHRMEQELTYWFQTRRIENAYQPSHAVTHTNGKRFDEYAQKYWRQDKPVRYAFWGISENNLGYWKNYIETRYPQAQLIAVFDSFRDGMVFGFPYQRPEMIAHYPDVHVVVCSVGAAQAARRLFTAWQLSPSRCCIVSDCFMRKEDVEGRFS